MDDLSLHGLWRNPSSSPKSHRNGEGIVMNEQQRERDLHVRYLRKCIEVSEQAILSGNMPFGAILVAPSGEILLEKGNIEVTGSIYEAETAVVHEGYWS
ncbi:hypothetical protein Back11_12990 [Paenibacillus baekrokdamisoli]|uniref:Uncharacterized protein n=1 Tax=Paenibacillus baekrokdamisoli TaxID=1712516 RepID=A0A3G9J9H9_9BACL|nr:hypothetical protein [Paenibacillus baekrokdamisoli]MBB3070603.1 hypothetical protein [Paenibacillus baekrokdamisoli]BBH19954.1 hypothetical protein Back11_12990 [Paenibacillus baekrokdamisoli]